MKLNNRIVVGITVALICLLVRLYCGIYVHDEFAENNFFIKHRATWKWKFYSPIGQSDLKINDLPFEERIEQKYFNEFVRDQNLSR